ncbi:MULTISPECIES: hypothetical protein [Halolamina]|uniref:hypothetical protein n=1 Tax=Halolamina TaxID=1075397 RepID=UPI0009422CDF|nr:MULTISPECIES: hypothetical protein [Halolamina]NHX37646.1 hypothetical protein [Halolamina sp. R1-12]
MSKVARSRERIRSSEIEPAVFEVCWRLYKRDETDLLDGGVASARIAEELDATHSTTRSTLQRLQQRGVVTALDGAAPHDLRARQSFVPTALLEGGESA